MSIFINDIELSRSLTLNFANECGKRIQSVWTSHAFGAELISISMGTSINTTQVDRILKSQFQVHCSPGWATQCRISGRRFLSWNCIFWYLYQPSDRTISAFHRDSILTWTLFYPSKTVLQISISVTLYWVNSVEGVSCHVYWKIITATNLIIRKFPCFTTEECKG